MKVKGNCLGISSELDILIRPLNMFALQYFAFIRDDGEVSGVYFTAWAAEVMLLALVAIVDIIIEDLTRMGINYFSSNNVASRGKSCRKWFYILLLM